MNVTMRSLQETKVQIYKHWLILGEDFYEASKPELKTPSLGDQRRRKLFGGIVFLALALESFINEVGLELCKDEFNSIDRLSPPDKWHILPMLCGKNLLRKDREPHQSICEIFHYRNLFVHFKPQYRPDMSKDQQMLSKVNHAFFEKLYRKTIEAMLLVSDEFELPGTDWLRSKHLK